MAQDITQLWEQRIENEEQYLDLHRKLLACLENELPVLEDSKYWKAKIEIQQIKNDIAAKESYINSLKTDKAQQDAARAFKMHLAKEKGTIILQKARSPLMRGDTALQLQGILKEKHESGTDEWADWIWRINDVLNKTNA